MFAGGVFSAVKCTVVIPPGPAGTTGFALGFGHVPVIPRNAGSFYSGEDEPLEFDLTFYPQGVAWSIFLCNNDLQSHIWQTRWEANRISNVAIAPPTSQLSGADILAAATQVGV